MVAFTNDALSKLCSKDQLALLDSIDRLRLQGINNYVSLPQIIVCGDQSSGKSSVLEAISGVSFPIKSNLCTRFPTELVLRKTSHISATVSIVPHESRSDPEKRALRSFREELSGFDDLPRLVESAKVEMGITAHGRAFAKDVLRIEITGPDRPHLTIVDLPGLIHSETKSQTSSDVELIQGVVQSYMKQSRCIILAVVSAKNDFANQVVLKLARAADTSGNRTLGVITKPDTLTPGSDSEALFVSLARNQEVEFRHGWHVLKNMDSEKGSWSLSERDTKEAEFFSSGVWTELPLSSLGIDKLRGRLSKVLLSQIASELPNVIDEINRKFKSCQEQLARLGEPRSNPDEQRLYLVHLSQVFQALVKASASGNYNNTFFGDAKTESGYRQRIRAVVQNLNEDFAAEMLARGHYREIVDIVSAPESPRARAAESATSGEVTKIERSAFIDHIKHLMGRTRGLELPGTFNPMIVADLFLEQSQPWEGIVRRHVERVWRAASRFLNLVITHTADTSTAKALHLEVFEPAMKIILEEMRDKTTELLKPHQNGHPITYNHYFTETLQSIRRERRRKEPERILCRFFGLSSLESRVNLGNYYNLQHLANSLAESTEPDLKRFAASEALDCLDAYYKVALKRFIDDVAVEVIEAKLVSVLDDILSPLSVYQMPADKVARIAGESEETRTEREQLRKQLEVLQNGLDTCKQFAGFRISGGESRHDSVISQFPEADH
ncbi:Interferon-induced GTP-binding protein Mx [Madurella mycetomatis]|uniref:Interferon-induced GTP-binding protein Mx n=1 Tax=Madurella mycetomatis TaxID=100816 RepID=A0A175VPE4_9PEZI|nr:Interferon-induced GTP-binding protein Mx [Madurella mycetomatis]KXX80007.1 Interferon-induced GTP-binding protein Mx [Madurella mycetomatis]